MRCGNPKYKVVDRVCHGAVVLWFGLFCFGLGLGLGPQEQTRPLSN